MSSTSSAAESASAPLPPLKRAHATRLRQIWRSAGWPAHDTIEIDLLAAGWLERRLDACGRDRVVVTPLGVAALSAHLVGNRSGRDPHETLVERTAAWVSAQGRHAFTRTQFRVKAEDGWKIAMPDVLSIRRTTRLDGLAPVAYEVKARRADLLGDVRNPAKRAGYRQVSSAFYYVIAEGIGTAADVPDDCGLIVAGDAGFAIERASPVSEVTWSFAHWMALVVADRHRGADGDGQLLLGADPDAPSEPGPDAGGPAGDGADPARPHAS